MAEDEKTPDAGQESHAGSAGDDRPAAAQARTESPAPHFDHAKAWSEAFAKLADLPEALLNSLEERASSRKKDEKQPEEKVVHQEQKEEKIESPTPGGGENKVLVAEAKRPGWGHRFLEPRKRA